MVTKNEARSLVPLPRATVKRNVPSSTDAGNATSSSSSVALRTVICVSSQNTVGFLVPKPEPLRVTVSLDRSTEALVTMSCFEEFDCANRVSPRAASQSLSQLEYVSCS